MDRLLIAILVTWGICLWIGSIYLSMKIGKGMKLIKVKHIVLFYSLPIISLIVIGVAWIVLNWNKDTDI